MIKKPYLSLILLTAIFLFNALPACALDGVEWGIFEDYTIKPNKYAFNKIFNKEPINYYILPEKDTKAIENDEENKDIDNLENIANSLGEKLEAEKTRSNFSKLIENAFNIWFEDTKNMIVKDGREKEFNDIINILKEKVSLKRVRKFADADIVFTFVNDVDKHCSRKAGGCISWKKFTDNNKIFAYVIIPNPLKNTKNYSEDKVFHVLTHEIGHYFGLTDQFYLENYKKNYTIYNNPRIGYKKSIMGASYIIGLDCDDVDGFINLIDLTLAGGNEEKFSERAQNIWASFCNGKNEYFFDTYYRNAQPVRQTVANWIKTPFNAYGSILSYDDKGRILNTTDGINRYTFNYTETENDNFISAFRNGKEFKIKYGMDDFNISLKWRGEGYKPWEGDLFFSKNEAGCLIYYNTKIFIVENGECHVAKDFNDSDEEDLNGKRVKRSKEDEKQREYEMLEGYLCPFIQTECSFFKKIYESLK